MAGTTDIPHNRAEEEPPREDPANAVPAEGKRGRTKTARKATVGTAFIEHARDSIDELETLGQLLVQSEGRHRDSRTQGLPRDLSGKISLHLTLADHHVAPRGGITIESEPVHELL